MGQQRALPLDCKNRIRASFANVLCRTLDESYCGWYVLWNDLEARCVTGWELILFCDRPHDLVGLGTFFTLDDVELDGVTLFEGLVTFRLDRAVVHENVRAAVPAKEAVALGVVEPLHRTCVLSHVLHRPGKDFTEMVEGGLFGEKQSTCKVSHRPRSPRLLCPMIRKCKK